MSKQPAYNFEKQEFQSEEFQRQRQKPYGQFVVKRLRPDAVLPRRATELSAGLDLYQPEDSPAIILHPLVPVKVQTGLAMKIPPGFYGRIAPRSGLGSQGVHILAGVVDADYRGEVGVRLVLIAEPGTMIKIPPEKAFAQLILEVVGMHEPVEGELDDTERGAGGFGSTDRQHEAVTALEEYRDR